MIVSMRPEAIFTFISPFSLAIIDMLDAVEKVIALLSDDMLVNACRNGPVGKSR
jgi:hypothetical protein